MTWIQGLVLGIVQGLTEFLPVSSSGHLILTPILFGWRDQGLAFDTVLHLGTLAALLWFFRADLLLLLKQAFQSSSEGKETRIFLAKILVAIVPILVLAALLNSVIETQARNPLLVAFDLAFWGGVLLFADWRAEKRGVNKQDQDPASFRAISWKQALIIGCAQPLSILPGTSRSGITITAGLFAGLSRATAARFSFLISIPVTAAAGLHGVWELSKQGMGDSSVSILLIGFFAALISGVLAIRFLLSYVSKYRYHIFAYYRWALALLVLWIV